MRSTASIVNKLERFMNRAYHVPSEIIEELAEHAEYRSVNKLEPLCVEGEVFNKFIFVSEGIFMLWRHDDDKEYTIGFGVEGDPFTSIASYLYGQPSLFSYTPVTDGEIIVIDNNYFKQLVSTTKLVNWLNTVLFRQIHALENRHVVLGQQDTYSRYLRLLELRPQILSHVPLKYIASYLGVTQSTLSRIRAKIAGKSGW